MAKKEEIKITALYERLSRDDEHHHKDKISEKIQRFACKCIKQITGKRTNAKCRYCITGKYDANDRGPCLEKLG